jgi:hypothetical protein
LDLIKMRYKKFNAKLSIKSDRRGIIIEASMPYE